MTLEPASAALPSFLNGYAPERSIFDELYDSTGAVRPEWEYLIGSISALGEGEFNRRCAEGRRLLQDSGVTYNTFGDSGRNELPWMLDPMPVLISSSTWRTIEEGLVQRVELLEALLRAALDQPTTSISRLPLLSAADRQTVLDRSAGAPADRPPGYLW